MMGYDEANSRLLKTRFQDSTVLYMRYTRVREENVTSFSNISEKKCCRLSSLPDSPSIIRLCMRNGLPCAGFLGIIWKLSELCHIHF